MSDTLKAGERIKQCRLERKLTLKDVEQKAKVSATHLSEIERGLTSPTIGALTRIADAMDVSPSVFMRTGSNASNSVTVTRHGHARKWNDTGWRAELTPLSDASGNREMSICRIDLDTGGVPGSVPARSSGESVGHVLAGEIEIVVGADRHALKAGDTIHFDTRNTHRIRNTGDFPATIVWATQPQAGL